MSRTFHILVLAAVCCLAMPQPAPGAVIFKPNKKARQVAAGGEEINGTAQELFQIGQAAENSGNSRRAQKAYRTLVRKFPKDTLAAGAAYRYAQLAERAGADLKAAAAYRVIVEQYPNSPNFDEAIEAQFRIGEAYLAGKKVRLLGVPVKSALEDAKTIFAAIVRTAPYGKYTARAQFNIGLVNEKRGDVDSAVAAYQAVSEKFPDQPVAVDAQYQIGYLWFNEARNGTRDARAVANARLAFQDFLFRYPKSEKAAQARENLRILDQRSTTDAFRIAKFYDKQKNYRAAVIYYNDVIRQQPGSSESTHAKQRVSELRAKVGDAALQSAALTAATAKKPKPVVPPNSGGARESDGDAMPMRTSPEDAPLPPPEADESLPPPATLTPDTTTAPDTSSPDASPAP